MSVSTNQGPEEGNLSGHRLLGCGVHFYLTESVYKVAFQESIPPQIRQLILHCCQKEQFDGFVRELTSEKRLHKHFL